MLVRSVMKSIPKKQYSIRSAHSVKFSMAESIPTICDYYKKDFEIDVEYCLQEARDFLDMRLQKYVYAEKLAVVFDIDDTAITHFKYFHDVNFEKMPSIMNAYLQANSPAVKPVLDFYNYVCEKKINVFFISARKPEITHTIQDLRPYTIKNLQSVGYQHYSGLYLQQDGDQKISTTAYKTDIRQNLNKQGYKIILNVGDQNSDFDPETAEKNIKIPNFLYPPQAKFHSLVSKKFYVTPHLTFFRKHVEESKSMINSNLIKSSRAA